MSATKTNKKTTEEEPPGPLQVPGEYRLDEQHIYSIYSPDGVLLVECSNAAVAEQVLYWLNQGLLMLPATAEREPLPAVKRPQASRGYQEKFEAARAARRAGHSVPKIATELGVSNPTIYSWVKDIPRPRGPQMVTKSGKPWGWQLKKVHEARRLKREQKGRQA